MNVIKLLMGCWLVGRESLTRRSQGRKWIRVIFSHAAKFIEAECVMTFDEFMLGWSSRHTGKVANVTGDIVANLVGTSWGGRSRIEESFPVGRGNGDVCLSSTQSIESCEKSTECQIS